MVQGSQVKSNAGITPSINPNRMESNKTMTNTIQSNLVHLNENQFDAMQSNLTQPNLAQSKLVQSTTLQSAIDPSKSSSITEEDNPKLLSTSSSVILFDYQQSSLIPCGWHDPASAVLSSQRQVPSEFPFSFYPF